MYRKRNLFFFRNYFNEFLELQQEKVKEKIDYVLFLIITAERIPKKFFSYVEGTDGLFEIRIEFESNIYRIFCCFDEGNLVVLFNGFQKRTQKTPLNEIDKAAKIKKDYFNLKRKINDTRKKQ
jgi:phage-related protein